MKLIITKENLIKALQKIIGVVEKKQAMPILSHVLFIKNPSGFEVVASDLEVQLSSSIKIDEEQDFNENIVIPGRKLFDIAKGLPEGSLLEIERKEAGKIQIKSAKSKFLLVTLDAKGFPLMDVDSESNVNFLINTSVLKDIINKTAFAMAQQDIRYYLNGLFISINKKEMLGVATDGHRLAKTKGDIKGDSEKLINAIIPRKGVNEIDKQLQDEDDETDIRISKNHILVISKDSRAISKLVDGTFPDFEKVISVSTDKKAVVDVKVFKEALSRVSILSNDRFRGIKLNFEENEIKISANNPEKEEASDDIKAEYLGGSLEVGFNVNYLVDILNVIKTKNVEILLKDANSSAILKPENDNVSCYVVMPLRL